jgi:hypothetical protein
MQALFMNLVLSSSCCFFLKQRGPKNALFLLLSVKCEQQQQTHKKNDVSNYGINLHNFILNSTITILPMFLAGEFSHKIEAVFAGFEGGFYGFGLWEVKMLLVWVMG